MRGKGMANINFLSMYTARLYLVECSSSPPFLPSSLPPSPPSRDLHKAHPELEQKVWIMETHATRSPVPGDPDTYNHWMSDEDILKMARVVRSPPSFASSFPPSSPFIPRFA